MKDHLQVEHREYATVITLNRPRVRNAITLAMWKDLGEVLEGLSLGPLRPVVIRGAGSAFSAGSDLLELEPMRPDELQWAAITMEQSISAVERMPMPVIASVRGPALGSAMELACACDIQVAGETATLGMPLGKFGLMLSPEFAKRIIALVGPTRAKYLLLTGRSITAREAEQIGLVCQAVPDGELDETVSVLTREMAGLSRHSLLAAKQAVYSTLPAPVPNPTENLPPYFVHEGDFREGIAAFRERHKPHFPSQPPESKEGR